MLTYIRKYNINYIKFKLTFKKKNSEVHAIIKKSARRLIKHYFPTETLTVCRHMQKCP